MSKSPTTQESREREKAERLAAALRANLRRRKTQARAIDSAPPTSTESDETA